MTYPFSDEIDEDLSNEVSGHADALRGFLKDNPGRAGRPPLAVPRRSMQSYQPGGWVARSSPEATNMRLETPSVSY